MYYAAVLLITHVVGGILVGLNAPPAPRSAPAITPSVAVEAPSRSDPAEDRMGNAVLERCVQAPTTLDRRDCFRALEGQRFTLEGVAADLTAEDRAWVDVRVGVTAQVLFTDSVRDWISRGSRIRFTGTVVAADNSKATVAAAHIDEILPHDVNSLGCQFRSFELAHARGSPCVENSSDLPRRSRKSCLARAR